ncbi:MAG: SIR2 family protein [Mycobacterium sp.]|nr:SIR2 family protein [Mycobacterium sp.]
MSGKAGTSHLESIVITSDDYEKLRRDRGALQAIVESLMLTSHIMFVGFSMGDPTFVHAAGKVQDVRKITRQKRPTSVGTVLALDERAVAIHPDFKVVPMLDHEDPREAARPLEIFLDRVAWRATTEGPALSTYLLDRSYRGLFPKAGPTSKLRAETR